MGEQKGRKTPKKQEVEEKEENFKRREGNIIEGT